MTLAISLLCDEGIVLAADSRATVGDPRGLTTSNDNVQKLFGLSDKIGIAIAGAGELGAHFVDIIENKITESDDIKNATKKISKAAVENFSKWYPGPRELGNDYIKQYPPLLLIVCGHSSGAPFSYLLNSQSLFVPQKCTMGFQAIGVVPLGVYLLNRLYKKDAPITAILELGAYCIQETASQDGKVGGPLQIMKIEPDRGITFLTKDDIKSINSKVRKHRENLQNSFYKLEEGSQ
jgi:20S proteasome alpha/beta subunit